MDARHSIDSPAPETASEPKVLERPEPVEYHEITDPGALSALHVIEQYFGQYDEIYLTPLLRKLSEVIGDVEYDPKSLISAIEEAGAVWLEKRKGFPYDYTVLIIDQQHPNIAAMQARAYASAAESEEPEYDEDAHYEATPYPEAAADSESEVYETDDYEADTYADSDRDADDSSY